MSVEFGSADVKRRVVVVIDRSPCWGEVLAVLARRDPELEARWFTPTTLTGDSLDADAIILGDVGGSEAFNELAWRARSRNPHVKIIVLSTAIERGMELGATCGDVDGIVSANATEDDFLRALHCALDGTSRPAPRPASTTTRRPTAGLTMAEARVLRLVAAGLSNDEIASALGISTNTVRTHVQRATTKLGADSRLRVAALARESGVLDDLPDTAAGAS